MIINWQTDTEVAYASIAQSGEASTTVLHYGQGFEDTGPVAAGMAGERFVISSAFGGTIEKWDGDTLSDPGHESQLSIGEILTSVL